MLKTQSISLQNNNCEICKLNYLNIQNISNNTKLYKCKNCCIFFYYLNR